MSIDYQFLASPLTGYEFEFTSQGTWQLWEKPRGIVYVFMMVIGGGGGGGDGFSDPAGGGGGAGGGSGGQNKLGFPADALPDFLYVYVGRPSERSCVALYPDASVVGNLVACSGDVAATAGANGGAAGSAAAGAAETLASAAMAAFQSLSVKSVVAGQAGAAGGAPNVAGSGVNQLTNKTVSGGTGGGGVTATVRAGGDLQLGQEVVTLFGGVGDAGSGASGPVIQRPWQPLSGTGAASSLLTNGGRGGNASFGGGGGGGGATTTGTGGVGGTGGGGYVLMVCL